MNDVVFRPYASSDFKSCMAIFDSNVPTFFALEERPEFCAFLDSVNTDDRPYLVLMRNGSMIACGGLIVEKETRQASLAWGMVHSAFHRQGFGGNLTQARLAIARISSDVAKVVLSTSQHTHGFYERFGFKVSKVTPDGFAPGLDRWDMVLHLE